MLRILGSIPDILLPDSTTLVQPDATPTARALLALELVQGSPGITADRLADKLGVSERAARRYVGILREAGIPIESVRGPDGGDRSEAGPVATLEEHLAVGWEYDGERLLAAAAP
jgi:HTH domain